jgi:hypothetical protein
MGKSIVPSEPDYNCRISRYAHLPSLSAFGLQITLGFQLFLLGAGAVFGFSLPSVIGGKMIPIISSAIISVDPMTTAVAGDK